MSGVNLLDWRQRKLQRRLVHWIWRSSVLLLLALMVLLTARQSLTKNVQQRQEILQQWQQADRQLQLLTQRYGTLRAQLQKLQTQVAQRQQQRQRLAYWQTFMRQLELSVPDELWLSSLKHQQHALHIEGVSLRPEAARLLNQRLRLPQFLQDWLPGALQKNEDGLYHFTLAAKLVEEAKDEK
ncbi:PilN domain-containing protein [Mixta intestinalis]|uniref:Uncharacterized protein n=1 Tax=Mixta intestinalis TaxID=1615494 RepID=A0A6P1Q6C4_9GAMM|nr:PilN domain-containing protein [Mixta intestinalis]QHM73508.1 hypothetical protein C7M51_03855 [Mixta intestinalis]